MTRTINAALALLVAFTLSLTHTAHAVENTWDYSVQVSSAVQASPGKVTLTWPQDTNGVPSSYTIYRRAPNTTTWGAGTTLAGSATSYVDTSVAAGNSYEYRIVKVAGSYTGYGYIQVGVNAPLVDQRGKVILVVDKTFTSSLAPELERLQQDLAGDGWIVIRRDVARTDSVPSVKAVIKAAYETDPANVKSVFLFGNIPVPYSGQLNPDGHPDHVGAWPADAYYGDMDGNWTDSTVNYTQTINTNSVDAARMSNRPGDGKFDQTVLPSEVELQVGRVDLSKMPGRTTWGGPATFPSELELLRNYLNKDHNFRHRKVNPPRRAILGDYFGQRGGEAFAASGFRSFAPLVGADQIRNLNREFNDQKGVWIPQVAASDYLLAYGCGAGSYASIGGLGGTGIYNDGTTTEMVSNNVRGVFNMLFGSWLGDWDHEDNILRSPLATSQGLVSAWSGRPHWFWHPLGAGETIGHTARLAMNNKGDYQTQINSSQNRIHVALMGDPTLRLHPVMPVGNLAGATSGSSVALTWSASPDSAIVGYHVYKATTTGGAYTRLTSTPVTATSFTDSAATAGATYMVRAIKLENTTSGSYHNPSQGIFWSTTGTSGGSTTLPPAPATAPASTTSDSTATSTPAPTPAPVTTSTTSSGSATTTTTQNNQTVVWLDDALPAGASGTTNGDTWNWVTSNPTPFSGTKAHKSDLKAGVHEHAFNWASPIALADGEVFFTYVYLDPTNPPSQIMLSFASANWEHRAYWGSNNIAYGVDKTASRYHMGPLPPTGKWVRLEVPASAVGLVGATVQGMAFSLYNGAATWDYTGKGLPAITTTPTPTSDAAQSLPSITVVATDASAQIGSTTDTAVLTFTRTGSTAANLTTNFTLSGTAAPWIDYRRVEGDMPTTITIPAGSASAKMTIRAHGNASNAATPTAIFTLAGNAAYTVDPAQKAATITLTPAATTAPEPTPTPAPAPTDSIATTTADTVWFDDALPAGAGGGASGGDAWTWVASNPSPFSGRVSHQSNIRAGIHEHYFNWASNPLSVATGDKLFVYVYIDPANLPSTLMVSWCSNNWEHRAYWGANNISFGVDKTASRHHMGALPAAGKWVRLEVPASAVGLEGHKIQGMSFSLFNGRAAWDKTGKASATSGTTSPGTTTPTTPTVTESVWVDDAPPAGAGTGASGGDAWNWVSTSPAPFAGTKAHQTPIGTGLREHWFNWATPLKIATGEVLFTYVYLDPGNMPSEVMLSFVSDNWEHRAYWGANLVNAGVNGTASRRYVGPLPAGGGWVRLEVPASAIGLEGHTVVGMSFGTYNGRATYDKTGKASGPTSSGGTTTPTTPTEPSTPVTFSTVSVTAADATATIGSTTDTAKVTFARTGSTTGDVTVKFVLGGSAVKHTDYRRVEGDMPTTITIPAGATSATMTILAIANSTNANPLTATFTLSPDAAYTVGTEKSAALTIASSGSSGGTTPPPTTTPTTPPSDGGGTTTPPSPVLAENAIARLPEVGDHQLRVLSPTLLELNRITTKQPDPAQPTDWNFVSSSGAFSAPAASQFAVTVNGNAVSVKSVGFRRRVAYAALNQRDLRIDNALFLELSSTVPEGATVEVKNPSASLWPSSFTFKSAASATRFNPAIHVNQEGYVPTFAKKAMIGYYLGSMGEMSINGAAGFKLVNAATGATVHTGSLVARKETGYVYSPQPYQQVFEADFTSFTTPGEYQLVVPGYGASLPFLINDGIAMNFTRTYAQGLYHQRCGTDCKLPFTRHTHGACHVAQAEVPSPQSSYAFTYTTIASRNGDAKNDPRHTAPRLVDEASLLYPFINKGSIDVSRGHHDAGDYSKYMTNSAALAHLLQFTADNIAGAGALDNLGLPESGDGISDLMQEAKHEADYIAKMQDADGGFYFLVYPKNRSYESEVIPGTGEVQVVWPKNTAASAAATAALAQLASSPKFKAAYPTDAAMYLDKAKKGWQFLMNAIAKYGKDGSYQKLTHYGHNFWHNDEIAWAAAELFLATGEAQYHQKLKEWFPNPSDPETFRWGWWRLSESYGNAIRSYAFAARSGRINASQLDAAYLAKCEEQIKLAGDDVLKWSNQSAYGTSLPEATRHVMAAGWFFSLDQAADMAVAYQLNPKPEYVTALVGNMNYEGGSNPINVPHLTGVGFKRQREIVHQWANRDHRSLPMNGIPQGNVQSGYDMLWHYSASGNELTKLSFPSDANSGATYPFYDRWADTWNVSTEFVVVNQARGLMAVAALATQTNAKSTAWKPTATATINVPSGVAPVGVPVTLSLNTSGFNLAGARILWEARDQQPDFGATYTITPKNSGAQWVEAEITWPDGRRVYATGTFSANATLVNWVDEALPLGATAMGSEPWTWVTSPTPKLGTKAHQSTLASGLHEHAFQYASVPMEISAGDTMFVWVYLDPANMPEQLMLSWNDGSWEHRAFWGADKISYGTLGTAGRYRAGNLPAGGQWVKLEVPAKAVGLEGSKIHGMSFSAFGGRVTWDATGKTSPAN